MICEDCGANMIGNIPADLYGANRCRKCYNEYMASGLVEVHKVGDKEVEKKGIPVTEIKTIEEIASDERINNRWDILDI